jgi:hypothetical protein
MPNKTEIAIVIFALLLAFGAGYKSGQLGVLNKNFWQYTMQGVPKLSDGLPQELDKQTISVKLADGGDGITYTWENVTIKRMNFTGWTNGAYLLGNEILVRDFKENYIGHELCHFILHRYGFEDLRANEQVCYTIGANYYWLGGSSCQK